MLVKLNLKSSSTKKSDHSKDKFSGKSVVSNVLFPSVVLKEGKD